MMSNDVCSFQGTYIFTVNLPANSGTPAEFVSGILTEQLRSFASFQVIEIVRYGKWSNLCMRDASLMMHC